MDELNATDILSGKTKADQAIHPFKKITKNKYMSAAVRKANMALSKDCGASGMERCDCKSRGSEQCDEFCENRLVQVECTDKNCSFGAAPCGNRCFASSSSNPWDVELRYCGEKGYGAFASKAIPANTFVVEYVGDVIDKAEVARRKKLYQESGNPHFYLMEVGPNVTIDAGMAGGLARFLNHSCDPNCMTQKWQVGQETRVAMFSTRDIAEGEELSYDYQWSHFGEAPWKCLCGAATCRGFLADAGAARKHRAHLRARRNGIGLDDVAAALDSGYPGAVAEEYTYMPFSQGGGAWVPMYGAKSALPPDDDRVMFHRDAKPASRPSEAVWGSASSPAELRFALDRKLFIVGQGRKRSRDAAAGGAGGGSKVPRRAGLLRARAARLRGIQEQVIAGVDASVQGLVRDEVNAWLLRGNTEEASGGDRVAAAGGSDANQQVCSKCSGVGSLLCCDLCPNAFHLSCIGMMEHEVPEGIWACPHCVAAGMASIKRW